MGTTTNTMRRAHWAVAVAGLAALSAAWVDAARPAAAIQRGTGLQPFDGPKQERVSADINIMRSRVGAGGAPEGVATQVMYHWVRERVEGRWRTTVTLPWTIAWAVDPQTSTARDVGERAVRVEDDEDGTPLRFYNRRGEHMQLPSAGALEGVRGDVWTLPGDKKSKQGPAPPAAVSPQMLRPAFTPPGRSWADTLIADAGGTSARRQALEQTNGASKGRVRGLDRFVAYRGDAAIETLVDPASAVPVEVNVVRGGALVMQTVISYAPGPDGALVRQRMYSTRLAGSAGGRATVDMQFTNVVASAGGGK